MTSRIDWSKFTDDERLRGALAVRMGRTEEGKARVARLAATPLAGETVHVRWVDEAGAHVSVEADGYRMTVIPVDWLVSEEGTR